MKNIIKTPPQSPALDPPLIDIELVPIEPVWDLALKHQYTTYALVLARTPKHGSGALPALEERGKGAKVPFLFCLLV